MRCQSPIQIPNKSNHTLATSSQRGLVIPCSQCLHCRLNRRDKWVARAILESHASFIGQFWTLTFSDDGLNTLREKGAKKLVSSFQNALRMSEQRAGNPLRIRSFGCLEYGETYGRPHVHLMIWNHLHNQRQETPYRESLPRLRWNIGIWPHGHVDIQPLNTKSMRYVAKYVTKFEEDTEEEPIVFHCQRPPLGLGGLERLVRDTSLGPTRQWVQHPTIQLDGRTWALDQTMQKHYLRLLRQHGLKSHGVMRPSREQYASEQNQKHLEVPRWKEEHLNMKAQLKEEAFKRQRENVLRQQASGFQRYFSQAALSSTTSQAANTTA